MRLAITNGHHPCHYAGLSGTSFHAIALVRISAFLNWKFIVFERTHCYHYQSLPVITIDEFNTFNSFKISLLSNIKKMGKLASLLIVPRSWCLWSMSLINWHTGYPWNSMDTEVKLSVDLEGVRFLKNSCNLPIPGCLMTHQDWWPKCGMQPSQLGVINQAEMSMWSKCNDRTW